MIAPYGSWKSPITSDMIVAGSVRLGQICLEGDVVYWSEGRPSENGRNIIIQWSPEDGQEEMTPAGFNVRSRVHEYGGGSFLVHDEIIYFINYVDQRLYVQYPYSEPEPLTTANGLRFADPIVDDQRARLICVRETHTIGQEPVNEIVALSLDSANERGDVLVAGSDFFASPRLNPDGDQLTWLTWNHPNMPWDGTELWVADVAADGSLHNHQRVAGGKDESVFQPSWSSDGVLHFVSDRSNWWNLYRWRNDEIEPLCPMEAEFGLPQWVFCMSTYGFESANSIICAYTQDGVWQLARLNTDNGRFTPLPTPYTNISNVHVSEGVVVFTGGSATLPTSVVRLNLHNNEMRVLRQSTTLTAEPGYLSTPQPLSFPTTDGQTAHAIYYPPQNEDFSPPAGEKPPLLVLSHGGPTGATSTTLNLSIQYWTSRGFAVLDVNYRGSTGYGRSYRQQLNGQWGIADVADCINGAAHLVAQGLADPQRLAIRGGSAGGFTTLCALTFHDDFSAGASHYGVSDIEALAKETHKFESRYLDTLIGPYPEQRDRYLARSPIHHVDQVRTPIILFQGLEDKVVPPNQTEKMFAAVKAKGVPSAYVPFANEQHGFRQAPNIKRALDAELYFYGRIFGFELAEPVEPVPIENLP